MGNFLHTAIHSRLGRTTPSGWLTLNAPCCHHNGHAPDKRKRGGFKLDHDTLVYNCFNCNYRAQFREGERLTRKMKDLLKWMGFTSTDIGKFQHEALAHRMRANGQVPAILPDNLKSIVDWLEAGCEDGRLLEIADLMDQWGDQDLTRRYWTPDFPQYVITLHGDLSFANGWWGHPLLDKSLPEITDKGEEPTPPDDDDDIPPATLEEMRKLVEEND